MTHLALVGLLAGSLALTPPDGTGDDKKITDTDKPAVETVETPGVFHQYAAEQVAPTVDTYALGRPAAEAPIKLWAQYAYGKADSYWDTSGDTQDIQVGRATLANGTTLAGSTGEVVSQRVQVGAQINFLSFQRFSLGAGATLNIAKNNFNVDQTGVAGIGDLESDFGLQAVKVYGQARGRVVGVHGGYQFDLGSEQTFNGNIPADLSNSDGRDAIWLGADFDYPSTNWRLFGGVDYYMPQGIDSDGTAQANGEAESDWWNYLAGVGYRFSFLEIGAAAQIVTRVDNPTLRSVGTTSGIGGHAGTIVPYLRISPPSLPASIYIKGATPDEYHEYGIPIGGANSVKPKIGFTAGLSVGFN